MSETSPLLRVTGLVRHFPFREMQGLRMTTATVKAVDGIDFSVRAGRTLGIVGESGCGKSTTARLLTRLDEPTGGRIEFRGRDISHVGESQLRSFRRDVQMVFQDPYSSLNPRHTVGSILRTPLRVHGLHPGREKARVRELLELVGLGPEHANRYPSEFSGGQRQRIGIARALAVEPRLIVADEPVSALDVSIQAQVMNLLATLRTELGLAFVLVAHDLGVVRHFCDEVAVMHLGKIVEHGERRQIYAAPVHPYTQALLSAAPDINVVRGAAPRERIRLAGDVPSPIDPPSGCHFRTRCWKVREVCHRQEPPLVSVEPVGPPAPPGSGPHRHACHFPEVRSRVVAQPPAGAGPRRP
ncbi:ABC transporter ATP-binding protein [Intrasporangium calvum]|uniref:Oligopeptide/dipeptide ABC transporter, ATPase subunit n=1 Tax=Intrasporangium calvum (strain ATCC 23552 / DSM 43043 / JCM 3097 / NBRC 12989 / NCIMB 10167 / NRRL B-3866 / 7 KIP) TaxID=710696 RepID=E6S8W2_INTC7|nr:oligopeptide/dipeptide ABC transporter ATP-binding protein [Intrasporangium calvum]ADU48099.1 oligopeptide/dipeptide ABC transporter, ATPase subunit [Intrasporangium calvum DSM 43043]